METIGIDPRKIQIRYLDISTRTHNILRCFKIRTLGDLVDTPFEVLIKGRNVGSFVLGEINKLLTEYKFPIKAPSSHGFIQTINAIHSKAEESISKPESEAESLLLSMYKMDKSADVIAEKVEKYLIRRKLIKK